LPFVVWTVIERDRRAMWTLLVGGCVAVLVLFAFNPCWWGAPMEGVRRFLTSNLSRAKTIPIPVSFLGRVIETPKHSLPWYNTLVWTVFVTPVGFLALALVGTARALRRWRSEPFGLLAAGHWVFLLALRALPHTPGHDGVRQFLPAFGILAILAGLGARSILERSARAAKVVVAAALAEAAIGLALIFPVPLSYFSPIVGGLPGAARLGMEPTYFWDGLSDEALDFLNRNTPPGEKVRFATNPTSWLYLKAHGRIRPEFLPWAPGRWAWYVLQNRPGAFSEVDRALVERGKPAFVVRKWGVPLVWVFPYPRL
jgi:hypothetical protein